jgi:hypothetical protein
VNAYYNRLLSRYFDIVEAIAELGNYGRQHHPESTRFISIRDQLTGEEFLL